MQAVILAAGMGVRIRECHILPKGFICLNDQPIIQQSIHQLKQCGILEILIVTGYGSNYYHHLAEKDFAIETVFNPFFDTYGSLFSLYCAKNWIKTDFLLLESDIVYENKALTNILSSAHLNTILLSGETYSTDEVYVEAHNEVLINMSKQKNKLNTNKIYGEFVGINKLSYKDYMQLVDYLDQNPKLLHSGHYDEHGLVTMTHFCKIMCLKIPDLRWCEIDDHFHLQRARNMYENTVTTKYFKETL